MSTSLCLNFQFGLSLVREAWTDLAPPYLRLLAWVRSVDEDDLLPKPASNYFPPFPVAALVAHHSGEHSETQRILEEHRSDNYRTRTSRKSGWASFAQASQYPHELPTAEVVTTEWLDAHCGDQSRPWLADRKAEDGEEGDNRYHAFHKKRQVWYKRMQFTILRNPFIPLVFRLIIFFFAAIALAVGGSIYHLSDKFTFARGASAIMAIIVDAVAMVYICWITYDEYRSKPLGLRSARAKVRIVLLDLFFIVFESANLALAFEALSINGQACVAGPDEGGHATNGGICSRKQALASVLFVALIAWLMTFSVSVIRQVTYVLLFKLSSSIHIVQTLTTE